jgi:ATP-dependent Clp protease ATP-binding subunit ClpX
VDESIELTFTDEALQAIAKKAVDRKAGARGLRTILEEIMLDIMYDAPSQENLREVLIDESTVLEGNTPKCIFKDAQDVS